MPINLDVIFFVSLCTALKLSPHRKWDCVKPSHRGRQMGGRALMEGFFSFNSVSTAFAVCFVLAIWSISCRGSCGICQLQTVSKDPLLLSEQAPFPSAAFSHGVSTAEARKLKPRMTYYSPS